MLWMWGDRFLDGNVTGIGKWEASQNETAPAVAQVPKDIVICDWHYERAEPTAAYFAIQGFQVLPSPWRLADVAWDQLDQIQALRKSSSEPTASRPLGMLQTSWVGMGSFMKAYHGEASAPVEAQEAAYCFKTLLAEVRKRGLR